jgi:hypothetical protein
MQEQPYKRDVDAVRNHTFVCSFDLFDPVTVTVCGQEIPGWIRAVTFTYPKVRFAVIVDAYGDETYSTLHNIDSALVKARDGERLEGWAFDNYS